MARATALDLVDGGDHDDRDRPQRGVRPQALEHLEAVHLRHHDVEEHEIDRARREDLERRASVDGGLDLVAQRLEPPGEEVAVGLDVVDDQEAAGSALHAGRGADPSSCRRYGICFSAARSPSSMT